jgi:hypothetical protein
MNAQPRVELIRAEDFEKLTPEEKVRYLARAIRHLAELAKEQRERHERIKKHLLPD